MKILHPLSNRFCVFFSNFTWDLIGKKISIQPVKLFFRENRQILVHDILRCIIYKQFFISVKRAF
jgi:hypothetical protein